MSASKHQSTSVTHSPSGYQQTVSRGPFMNSQRLVADENRSTDLHSHVTHRQVNLLLDCLRGKHSYYFSFHLTRHCSSSFPWHQMQNSLSLLAIVCCAQYKIFLHLHVAHICRNCRRFSAIQAAANLLFFNLVQVLLVHRPIKGRAIRLCCGIEIVNCQPKGVLRKQLLKTCLTVARG